MIITITNKLDLSDYETEIAYPYIEIKGEDSESVVSCYFQHGEPEDRTVYRDFDGVFSIEALVKMAYEAGRKGEDLIIKDSLTND